MKKKMIFIAFAFPKLQTVFFVPFLESTSNFKHFEKKKIIFKEPQTIVKCA